MSEREITGISWPDGDTVTAGADVTIEEYTESGSMAPVPYIRVNYERGTSLEVCKHQLASVEYRRL